jgi:hypothetical protein
MKKKNTPMSIMLGALAGILIVIGIFQPNIRSSPLSNFYFFIPMALIYGSLKSMKPVDKTELSELSKRTILIKYTAAYVRMAAGLMIVGAIVIYSRNQRISIFQFSYESAFLVATFVAFIAAVVLTILSSRSKPDGSPAKEVERL